MVRSWRTYALVELGRPRGTARHDVVVTMMLLVYQKNFVKLWLDG